MDTLQLFTTLLIVQVFWSFGVTLLVPNLINAETNQVVMFNNSSNVLEIGTLQTSMSQGITEQTSIPVLEAGALIFYSSATILSLMVNFFTAVPQMATLLAHVFFMFIPIGVGQQLIIKTWVFAIITVLYVISLFAFIAGTRTNLGAGGGIF